MTADSSDCLKHLNLERPLTAEVSSKREMSINPMKWKTKNIVAAIFIICIFYLLFIHKESYRTEIEGVIQDTNPIKVWEFVADFSNMKLLNPLIEDFNIIAESGNYDHWHEVNVGVQIREIQRKRHEMRRKSGVSMSDGG
ncbi:hypothetical protein KPH14_008789 [Odynerus spinipes]|uniref:Uncharacterized protein n=1 Tax=Odynerus spinipes TaxID=1348599 RepID=A0AAD9R903_9HYME|nr:hypothetical protein KPH14_008789 [Odynerus spinipes]